jgi:WD40 repeat protein
MGGMSSNKVDSNGFASVGHLDGSVSIWNLSMRKCFANQILHSQQVRGVSYSVDGNYVASAGYDGAIHISETINLEKMRVVKTLNHDDKVVSVKWHPYLPLLLSSGADRTARIWYP